MLAALASSPATKALDPDPFPRHSLRHAVYAALLHFGFETADEIQEAMWPLCYEILAFEASTLADLALQMRAVQYIESEWWEEELTPTDEHGSYMDGYSGHRLVESALRMIEQPGVTLTAM